MPPGASWKGRGVKTRYMRCQCSYCQIIFDVKEPFDIDDVSHGVCEECWPWLEHNLEIEIERLNPSNSSSGGSRSFAPASADLRVMGMVVGQSDHRQTGD
jgi:hypothetical protein